MNIYFCRESCEDAGLFVFAPTRGRAKVMFAHEVNCNFTDVRCALHKRGVCEPIPIIVDDVDSPLLKKYGLEYTEGDEW